MSVERQGPGNRQPAAGLTLQIVGPKLECVKVQLMDPEPGGGAADFCENLHKSCGWRRPQRAEGGEERSQSHV